MNATCLRIEDFLGSSPDLSISFFFFFAYIEATSI